jgi:hypothetical protein
MGLLHPTAKTGATGFGNSVPLSLPDRHRVDRAEEPEPGATEFGKPVPLVSAIQSRCRADHGSF